jgi:hypothetical protein
VEELVKYAYRKVSIEEPPVLDSLIPTQDLRLTDQGGRTFAVLELSEAGDPAMVLLDETGAVLACWEFFERKWSGVQLYDNFGEGRFAAELRPRHPPMLAIFEEPEPTKADIGSHTLDPHTYEEVPVKNPFLPLNPAEEISWLSYPKADLTVPLCCSISGTTQCGGRPEAPFLGVTLLEEGRLGEKAPVALFEKQLFLRDN